MEDIDSATYDPNYSRIVFSDDSQYIGYDIVTVSLDSKEYINSGVFWINKKIIKL